VSAHDHSYQRWSPLNAATRPAPDGVVQLVAGTGGHGIRAFARTDPRVAEGIDQAPDGYGALRLELRKREAQYQFVNVAGETLDAGATSCRT
jgi:hypothetical protein